MALFCWQKSAGEKNYFKKYTDHDYEAVCDFLIELNVRDAETYSLLNLNIMYYCEEYDL